MWRPHGVESSVICVVVAPRWTRNWSPTVCMRHASVSIQIKRNFNVLFHTRRSCHKTKHRETGRAEEGGRKGRAWTSLGLVKRSYSLLLGRMFSNQSKAVFEIVCLSSNAVQKYCSLNLIPKPCMLHYLQWKFKQTHNITIPSILLH